MITQESNESLKVTFAPRYCPFCGEETLNFNDTLPLCDKCINAWKWLILSKRGKGDCNLNENSIKKSKS